MTSLIIAFVMSLWVIAALYRNSFMSSAVVFAYQKTEAHYQAKAGISRALDEINGTNGALWISSHTSESTGSTDPDSGAIRWAETSGGGMVLKSKAGNGSQSKTLTVPLKTLDNHDTHLYSITPSASGGPDLIAWKTTNGANWQTLPAIPGMTSINSIAGSGNGDVFTVASGTDGATLLWRYRVGRGWSPMPKPPTDVSISSLAVGASSKLITLGVDTSGNKTLQHMDLNESLEWKEAPALPSGHDMTQVTISTNASDEAYVASVENSEAHIHRFDFATDSWTEIASAPEEAHFDAAGLYHPNGDLVENFDGGIGVDPNGHIYAASNSGSEPSAIYRLENASPRTWRIVPPITTPSWDNDGNIIPSTGYATILKDLKVDDDGVVWVQWQSPVDDNFGTMHVDTSSL